jgi:hypothetical protein
MSNSEALIFQYETWRGKVAALKRERSNLIQECPSIDEVDDFNGEPVSVGVLCLHKAFDEMLKMNEENDDTYAYDEVLAEVGCEHCIKSYQIKSGPLAEARKEFGNIKRRLSYAGKKLIKGSQ